MGQSWLPKTNGNGCHDRQMGYGAPTLPLRSEIRGNRRVSIPFQIANLCRGRTSHRSYAPVQSSVEQFFSHHYAPYYINARENEDLTEFIRNCLDICPSLVRHRREYTHSVVQQWFSADAEINKMIEVLRA